MKASGKFFTKSKFKPKRSPFQLAKRLSVSDLLSVKDIKW